MALGGLVVYLTANTAQFTAAMQGAASVSQNTSKNISRSLGLVELSLVAIAAKATLTFVQMSRDALQFGNDITKAADKASIGTEEMAKLAFAGRAADVDLQSLSTAIKAFQVSISKASAGTAEQKDALEALGLTAKDLIGLSLENQFKVIAEQISKLKDPTDKTRAAVALFGRAGADLLPMFTEGASGIAKAFAEYQRLNGELTKEKIAKLKESADATRTLGEAWDGFARTLTAKVAPALTVVLDTATKGLMPTDPARMIKDLEYRLAGLERANDKSENSEYARTKRRLEAFRAAVAEQARIAASAPALPQGPAPGFKTEEELAREKEMEQERLRLQKEAEAELKRLAAERKSILDGSLNTYMGMVLTAEELAVWELSRLNPSKEQLAIIVAQGEAIKNLRLQKEAEAKAEAQRKKDESEKAATIKNYESAVYSTSTALEKYAIDLEHIYAASQRYMDAGIDVSDVMKLQQRSIDALQKSFSPLEKVAIEFGDRMSSAFEEAILSGKGFSDILKSLLQDILKIIVRLTITEPLGNAIANWVRGGGFGGFLNFGSFFGLGGSATGGGLESLLAFGPSFLASGGFASAGRTYVVGEKGPELFRSQSSGTVVPNGSIDKFIADTVMGVMSEVYEPLSQPRVQQVFNITTPNADSFRLSQRQIARRARLAVNL